MNVMHKSDANRGLAEECGLTLPTIRIMDAVDSEFVLVQVRVSTWAHSEYREPHHGGPYVAP